MQGNVFGVRHWQTQTDTESVVLSVLIFKRKKGIQKSKMKKVTYLGTILKEGFNLSSLSFNIHTYIQ